MATLNFSTDGIEPAQPFDVIPRGRYEAMIVASEEKQTKSGTGSYLQLDFQIVGDEQHGRHVWARLNLDNPNETAVKIARQELAAICMALGLSNVAESEELHDKPLMIDVAVEKNKSDGSDTNRIKAYLAVGPQATTRPAAPAPRQSPPPPAAAKPAARPWVR